MSDAPRDVGSTAGRRLVRTGSPRGREVVLTFPRRLVAPGIAAALLVVGAVFTAGFVVGRDSADEAPAPETLAAGLARADADAAKTDAAKTDAAKTDAAKTDAAKTDAARGDASVRPVVAVAGQGVPAGAADGVPGGGRDASVGPDASKALPAAEPAADAALAGIDVVVGAPAKKGGWGLQVGAYPSLDEARAYVGAHAASLRAFRVHLIPTEITGRGTWHRVRIGYYSSRAEAEVAKKALPSDLASDALVVSYK